MINKTDLEYKIDRGVLESSGVFADIVEISAADCNENKGIDTLKDLICSHYLSGEIDYNREAVITNARQNASVSRALEYVTNAANELESGRTADTAGFDLEAALSELSELDGRRVTEEIVDGIFHKFCVGK